MMILHTCGSSPVVSLALEFVVVFTLEDGSASGGGNAQPLEKLSVLPLHDLTQAGLQVISSPVLSAPQDQAPGSLLSFSLGGGGGEASGSGCRYNEGGDRLCPVFPGCCLPLTPGLLRASYLIAWISGPLKGQRGHLSLDMSVCFVVVPWVFPRAWWK